MKQYSRAFILTILVAASGCIAPGERQMLDLCRNVKAKDDTGWTCLHLAVQLDDADIRHLIGRGADVNAKGYRSQSPLHMAIMIGKLHNVKILLEHGADANARNYKQETPIHLLAHPLISRRADIESLQVKAIKLLADHGADMNAMDMYGNTPLHQFCCFGSVDIISYLFEMGADPKHANKYGFTALHVAAMHANYPVIPALAGKGAGVNARSVDGVTPLGMARDRREKLSGKSIQEAYDKTIDSLVKLGGR